MPDKGREPVEFPFVDPPQRWKTSKWIEHEPGSRKWVAEGNGPEFRQWIRELHAHLPGNLIPLQWAAELVGVTRESVSRRVEAGMLTYFCFKISEPSESVFGRLKSRQTRSTYEYVAISECEAWRDIVADRYDVDLRPKKRE
jgi:hypothetical protein